MEFAHKLFSTRGGTLLLAGLAAVLAAVAVLVYVNHYRSSVKESGQPATVIVARNLIPKGTPGSAIASEHLFQAQQIRIGEVRTGALTDPAGLVGRVAAVDIYPGQQIVSSDFIGISKGTIAQELTGSERAITVPLDSAHGLVGEIQVGSRVDVYAGFNVIPIDSAGRPTGGTARPVLRLIVPDVPVLKINGGKGGLGSATTANVALKVTAKQAANLAFASDNGKLWLVLRPPTGAKPSPPNLVTLETEILGLPSVAAVKSFGGRP
jgi:Flp pilus assembly protein CpaB